MHKFSFCLITKNEEKNLEKCLQAIKPYGMEIVVTDTGSTDNTVEIAKKYTDSIYHFDWINDFSAARNFTAMKACNDFVLFLDTDEFTEEFDLADTLHLLNTYPEAVGRLTRRNLCPSGEGTTIFVDRVERLYSRKLYHYVGRIHEQVTPIAEGNTPIPAYEFPLSVYHEGYMGTPEQIKAKATRNLTLLLEDLKNQPKDPYLYYQIGESYSLYQDYASALPYYQDGLALYPDTSLEYVKICAVSYGQCLTQLHRLEEACALENRYPEYLNYADFVYMLANANLARKKILKARELYLHALTLSDYHMEGTNSFLCAHNLACIYEACEDEEKALRYYKSAGNFLPSQNKAKALCEKLQQTGTLQEAIFAKKLSLLVYCNTTAKESAAFLQSLEEQTLGLCHVEIILVIPPYTNETKSDSSEKQTGHDLFFNFEKQHPNSVIIYCPEHALTPAEAFCQAFSLSTTNYVSFQFSSCLAHPDQLRLLLQMVQPESVSLAAFCSQTNGYCPTDNMPESLYIDATIPQNKTLLLSKNYLDSVFCGKLYSVDFLIKNGIGFPSDEKESNNALAVFRNLIYSHAALIGFAKAID